MLHDAIMVLVLQVPQPETVAMPTLRVRGALHGGIGGLRQETGAFFLVAVCNVTIEQFIMEKRAIYLLR